MTRALARVEALTISFPGRAAPAVDGVDLEVGAGECVALVGESGSGKSLTARALLGLLPAEAIVRGRILISSPTAAPGEAPALEEAPARGARAWNAIRGARSGLVPQDALGALDPLRRVEHEVGDALRLHGLATGARRRERVLAALGAAGMPEPGRHLRQRSDELSGGLRQRALVASALIADPGLIVADEPTTALDAGHRGRVLRELRRRVDLGSGALLITHDLASVRGIADRVLVMQGGRIIETGAPSQVLAAPEHAFTRELLEASPVGRTREPRAIDLGAAPRLELRGISVAFRSGAGRHEVLSDASLAVRPGETVGLVGESGSGKTTLLRVALGLQAPDGGGVLVDGTDRAAADRRTRRELRRRIAFVPQDPLDSFPPGATGRAVLRDALRAAGVPRAEREGRAAALAEEVRLDAETLGRPAATLSGGQRQRLAIARALARDPELLLLDEPVSALDLTVQARVLALLDELQRRHGTAYLLVSHDEDVIRSMSDRVVRIEAGRVSAADPSPQ